MYKGEKIENVLKYFNQFGNGNKTRWYVRTSHVDVADLASGTLPDFQKLTPIMYSSRKCVLMFPNTILVQFLVQFCAQCTASDCGLL